MHTKIILIRYIFFISCLLIIGIQQVKSQLTYPYFQTFENTDFLHNIDINLDVNGPEPLPREDINVTYGRGYSWEITDTPQKNNNSLKLTVHPNDHNKKAEFPRSRSEITFAVQNSEAIYISYEIYLPEDEFVEKIIPESYHILHQFQASLWDPHGEQSFRVQDVDEQGNSINVNELLGVMSLFYNENDTNWRDVEFWTNDPQNIELHAFGKISNEEFIQRRQRLKIKNALEKGKWNEIIIKVNFSDKSDQGYYEFWFNRKAVTLDSIGNVAYNEFYASPKDEKFEPFQLKTGNVLYTRDTKPKRIPSLVKIGHYRQNIDYDQSLYLDNFRLWNRFPVDFTHSKNKTKIIAEQCNHKSEDPLIVYAYDDPDATQYTFRFTNTKNNKIKTFVSDGPALDLRRKRLLKGKKSYLVDVKSSSEFGESCLIKSKKFKQ